MMKHDTTLTSKDMQYLNRCLQLAREAFEAGDAPFGSILVSDGNEVIAEARNRSHQMNILAHPELELSNWAIENLTAEDRKATTMYTSGEHCPMCAAAHGWAGLGAIVYLSSARQLGHWRKEAGAPKAPVQFIPVQQIVPSIKVKGPAGGELLQEIKALQMAYFEKMK